MSDSHIIDIWGCTISAIVFLTLIYIVLTRLRIYCWNKQMKKQKKELMIVDEYIALKEKMRQERIDKMNEKNNDVVTENYEENREDNHEQNEMLNDFFLRKGISDELRQKYDLLETGFRSICKFDVDFEKEFIGWWLPDSRVMDNNRAPRNGRFLKIFFSKNDIRVQLRKPMDSTLLKLFNSKGAGIDGKEIPSETKLNYRIIFNDTDIFNDVYAYLKDSYQQEIKQCDRLV